MSRGLAAWHFECRKCGYESSSFEPKINEELARTQVDEDGRAVGLMQLRKANFRVILDFIKPFTKPTDKKLLEVGAAHGWFLEMASKEYETLGMEPDEYVFKQAQAKGLPVRLGYFPEALEEDELFDLIVFNDVLEHIPSLPTILEVCLRHLNPGGLLIVNLPNSKGMFFRLSKLLARLGWMKPFERMWQKGFPSPHLHYFSPEALELLACKQGFTYLASRELSAIQSENLMERLSHVTDSTTLAMYLQYYIVRLLIPTTRFFPSDIVAMVFRNEAK
jgi:2-polyprenyl-3-methyl-5-hydroxy-6-metoxy-1,4-benzoquinol methylase